VVATLGSEGAAFYDARSASGAVVPAEKIRTATTLGAGDFFRAGFILGLLRKQSLMEACQMGNLAAARHCKQGESEDPSVLFSKKV
jgi:sugar/nucleoside kinase (ribokinase family)